MPLSAAGAAGDHRHPAATPKPCPLPQRCGGTSVYALLSAPDFHEECPCFDTVRPRRPFGAMTAPTEAALTPLIEQLLAHRSVHAYLPDPVSDAQLAAIIAAARSAASSSNLNVWSVVAVRDQGKRAASPSSPAARRM